MLHPKKIAYRISHDIIGWNWDNQPGGEEPNEEPSKLDGSATAMSWELFLRSRLEGDQTRPTICMQGGGARGAWAGGVLLKAGGVSTVLDLVRADVTALRRQFSVVVEKTVRELHGVSCMEIDDAPAPRQQILVSRSFGVPITHVDGILEAVSEFASRAAERLRQQGSVAGVVSIFFTTSPFRTNDRQHSVNVTVPLVRPTADTAVLMRAAEMAVRTQFRQGTRYAKAGAVLSELQAVGHEQGELDLFAVDDEVEPQVADPRTKLMAAMDALNNRFGRDSVRLGSTAVASNGSDVAVWATKQERRSPRYTTRWDEIPVVRC